jgi:hypothetical protein
MLLDRNTEPRLMNPQAPLLGYVTHVTNVDIDQAQQGTAQCLLYNNNATTPPLLFQV